MIKVTVITPKRQLKKYRAALLAFPALASYRLQTAFEAEVIPSGLNTLRYYPGPSKNSLNSNQPFLWSRDKAANDRARRWFFANYPEGYERTGELARNWAMWVDVQDGEVRLSIENRNPGLVYVMGDLHTGLGQIPGHKRTGWKLAKPAIHFILIKARSLTRLTIGRLWKEVTR